MLYGSNQKKYLVTAPTFFKIQAISPIFIFTQVNQDELHWKEQKYTKLLKFTSIPSYYIVQYHRVETNLGVVCQSIHSSISISISEGSISKSLLSQLTPTNAILPSHTRWGISSSLKQIQDILWFFKVPSKHAFCEPETWNIHFVSTLTFPGFFLAMSLPFPPSRLPIWAKLEVTSTEGKIWRKKLKMLDRDRAGGFVPFASGFERAHLISLLDVQVRMLEIHWHMWLQSNSIQTQYQILGILWTSQNYLCQSWTVFFAASLMWNSTT